VPPPLTKRSPETAPNCITAGLLADLHVRNALLRSMGTYKMDVDFLPAAKQNVQRAFEDALKTLDELGREADRWEQARLVYALCSMAEGQYGDAAVRIFESGQINSRQAGRQSDPPEVACLLRT
jgi:predicted RNA-binding protein